MMIVSLVQALSAQEAERETSGRPITSVSTVRRLSTDEVAKAPAVKLKGVVTWHADSGTARAFILHDGQEGVFIATPQAASLGWFTPPEGMTNWLLPGVLLEVEGRLDRGRFSPNILPTAVRRLGTAPLPEPQEVSLRGIWSGSIDCQRVWDEGIVTAVEEAAPRRAVMDLVVLTVRGPVRARFSNPTGLSGAALLHARVRVTGSGFATYNARSEMVGLRIQTNLRSDLTVLERPPADLFAVSEVPVDGIRPFSPERFEVRRVKTRGTVLVHRPGVYLFLQAGDHGVRINTRQEGELRRGDVVEVSGYVDSRATVAEMEDAIFRKVGEEAPRLPRPVTMKQLMNSGRDAAQFSSTEDLDGALVTLEAELISRQITPDSAGVPRAQGELHLLVRGDGSAQMVRIIVPRRPGRSEIPELEPGARLKITAVASFSYNEAEVPTLLGARPSGVRFILDSPADLAVIRPAPWWNPDRAQLILVLVGLSLAGVLAWVSTLRLQVRRQARALRSTATAAGALQERHRLSREIHDSLEQYLAGVAMQLDAVASRPNALTEAAQSDFERARHMLAYARTEARNSVWDLRSDLMTDGGLPGALEALPHLATERCAVEVVIEGTRRPLTERTEMHLLRIAQEAVSNALRHGQPTRIEVRLGFADAHVKLEIRDNGNGFAPNLVSEDLSHFGLLGMRERARLMTARFAVDSAPGHGTVVTVVLETKA